MLQLLFYALNKVRTFCFTTKLDISSLNFFEVSDTIKTEEIRNENFCVNQILEEQIR